jgi:PPE-repeat protein
MAATAADQVRWLQGAAEQTKQTAMQARAAAAAYEHAHAMTVPPPAVTTNRSRLATLIATNLLGQNTAAIAATEEQYAEYWAQDATAMSGYATSAGTATQLPRFSSPKKSTNESGLTAQSDAVNGANANGAASPSASRSVSQLSAPMESTPEPTVGSEAEEESAENGIKLLDGILAIQTGISSPGSIEGFVTGIIGAHVNLALLPARAVAPLGFPLVGANQLDVATSSLGGGVGGLPATLARAGSIGPMSVPASWSTPSSTHIAALAPAGLTTLPGTEEAVASGYPGYPGMPGTGSRAMGAAGPPRYGVRLTVMPRPPAAG